MSGVDEQGCRLLDGSVYAKIAVKLQCIYELV